MIAIDKPSGVSVHQDGKSKEETISDWFIKKYPKSKDVGESIFVDGKEIKKPGIVHRLDKETSGVLLLVKNQKTFEFLKNQFSNREIKKTYNAIVSGFVKDDRGTIRKEIGRSPNDFRKRLAGRGARGELREAITEYSVLKRFESETENGISLSKFTYLEVRPKTGRTHQIRVHMKFINHPVVGDTLYNPKQTFIKGLHRLALHARKIEFKNLKGEILKIEATLPKEFEKVIK